MKRKSVIVMLAAWMLFFANTSTGQHMASAAADSCDATNALWIGTGGFGLNCLDDAGWHTFTHDNSQLQNDLIKNVESCGADGILVSHSLGLDLTTNGKTWKKLPKADFSGIEGIACAKNGDIWAAHFKGISLYTRGKWTNYDAAELGSGKTVDLVKGVAIAANGEVWTETSNSIARFDGNAWVVYEKGQGFDKDYFFNSLFVDSKGKVWAGHSTGVLVLGGDDWTSLEGAEVSNIQTMTMDAQSNLWAGTYGSGVSMYDGKSWMTYDRKNSDLTSNIVRALAIDGQGRVWIGTEYGLDMFDGKDWHAFQMHNSDVADNSIYALTVRGNGPKLPTPKAKKPGSITGIVKNSDDPIAGAAIELCTEYVAFFSDATPCENQPYTQTVQTDDNGAFKFDDVPVGRYDLIVQGPDGKWTDLGGLFDKFEVAEGQATDIGSANVGKK